MAPELSKHASLHREVDKFSNKPKHSAGCLTARITLPLTQARSDVGLLSTFRPLPHHRQKRLRFQTSPTRQQPSAASASPVIDLDRTVSPAASTPRASGRAYTHVPGSYIMKNLFPQMPIQYQSVSPKGAKPPAPIVCPDQPPDPKVITGKDIISHLFLSDESLGAVPTSISQCHTWAFFFNQALSAWNLLRGSARNGDLAAVSVNLEVRSGKSCCLGVICKRIRA